MFDTFGMFLFLHETKNRIKNINTQTLFINSTLRANYIKAITLFYCKLFFRNFET